LGDRKKRVGRFQRGRPTDRGGGKRKGCMGEVKDKKKKNESAKTKKNAVLAEGDVLTGSQKKGQIETGTRAGGKKWGKKKKNTTLSMRKTGTQKRPPQKFKEGDSVCRFCAEQRNQHRVTEAASRQEQEETKGKEKVRVGKHLSKIVVENPRMVKKKIRKKGRRQIKTKYGEGEAGLLLAR